MDENQRELLFSLTEPSQSGISSAREAALSFGLFQENTDVPPLFPGNKVGKSIPVMVEGTYFLKTTDKSGATKYRKVEFTPEQLERLARTQPRDVPFNYDHRRVSGPEGVKGWLRFGKHARVETIDTPTGPKAALFALPELNAEAARHVESGVFRDVSVEYREVDEVLTGCALTSYPVMREVQFFSEVEQPEAEAEQAPETETTDIPDAATGSETPKEEPVTQLSLQNLSAEDKQALFGELLGSLGLTADGLRASLETIERNKAKSIADAAAAEFGELTKELSFDLPKDLKTETVKLLTWLGQDEQVALFGETDAPADAKGVVKALIGEIQKRDARIVALMGDTASEDGQFGEIETEDQADPELDLDIVARLRAFAGIPAKKEG